MADDMRDQATVRDVIEAAIRANDIAPFSTVDIEQAAVDATEELARLGLIVGATIQDRDGRGDRALDKSPSASPVAPLPAARADR